MNLSQRSLVANIDLMEPAEIYALLRRRHLGDSEALKNLLQKQFRSIVLTNLSTISLYAEKVKSLGVELQSLGVTSVDNDEMRRVFLRDADGSVGFITVKSIIMATKVTDYNACVTIDRHLPVSNFRISLAYSTEAVLFTSYDF